MNIAIILAAGKSTRAGMNKLWADLNGSPLWMLAYQTFLAHHEIDRIILVVPKGEELRFLPFIDDKKTTIVAGGVTRMDSFKCGLAVANFSADDIIIDHNAANPFVTAGEISDVIATARELGAAAVCHPVVDTLVQCDENIKSKNCTIGTILERKNFRLMQTPQAVRGDILTNISNVTELVEATDLSTALAKHIHVELLPAHPANKKITTAHDLATVRAHTFIGEDSHRFLTGQAAEGTQLTLGGLTIADLPKLDANSDGDVILHAIGRALAEAANQNFSELADPLTLSGNQDSRDYLEPLLVDLKIRDLKIRHVSLSIEAARPRIDPLLPALKSSLAQILHTSENAVHISAHTGEDLTPFGRGEGIKCTALVQVLR